MKVLVYGTGVIGTIYGSVLTNAGHDVSHVVRPGVFAPGRLHLPVRLLDDRMTPPREVESVYRARIVDGYAQDDRYDLILVSVKHYEVPGVLAQLAAGAGPADILFFSNWWADLSSLDVVLGGRYAWGFPVAGGGWVDGVLEAALLDSVQLGALHGFETRHLARAKELFETAGLRVDIEADMLPWLWVHFATEAALISSAIAAGSVDALLDDAGALERAILAGRESLEVCRARGVDVDAIPDAQTFYAPASAVALGIQDFYRANPAAHRILERHNGVEELDRIYGDVVATGHSLGVPMPRLTALGPAVEAWTRAAGSHPAAEGIRVGAG